jgi:hypothetical protein
VVVTQVTATVCLQSEHHPEDDRNAGRNMWVRTLQMKYVINIEVHLFGYLYIFGSMSHLKILGAGIFAT